MELLARADDTSGLGQPLIEVARRLARARAASLEGQTIMTYRIERWLGSGGVGDVHQARDLKLGRDVALKFLPERADARSHARGNSQRRSSAARCVESSAHRRNLWARGIRQGAVMAAAVQPAGAIFSASTPSKLFDTARFYVNNLGRSYDVSADGRRFLMIKLSTASGQNGPAPSPSLVVVEHWTEELKARLPTK